MQACLREIALCAAVHGFEIKSVHLPGSVNRLPDLLSRWDLGGSYHQEFADLTHNANLREVTVATEDFLFAHEW